MNRNDSEACNQAEVLYEKPLSGHYDEVMFGSDSENTLWVRFSDQLEVNEWVGKFAVGGYGPGWVFKQEEPDKFWVSAGPLTYLVDATTRKLLTEFRNDNFQATIFDPNRKLIIAADHTDLHWLDIGGKFYSADLFLLMVSAT